MTLPSRVEPTSQADRFLSPVLKVRSTLDGEGGES